MCQQSPPAPCQVNGDGLMRLRDSTTSGGAGARTRGSKKARQIGTSSRVEIGEWRTPSLGTTMAAQQLRRPQHRP